MANAAELASKAVPFLTPLGWAMALEALRTNPVAAEAVMAELREATEEPGSFVDQLLDRVHKTYKPDPPFAYSRLGSYDKGNLEGWNQAVASIESWVKAHAPQDVAS